MARTKNGARRCTGAPAPRKTLVLARKPEPPVQRAKRKTKNSRRHVEAVDSDDGANVTDVEMLDTSDEEVETVSTATLTPLLRFLLRKQIGLVLSL